MTFPALIRNTYRKQFVRCPTLARHLYELSTEEEGETSVDLHAGAAFARGLEVARRAFFELGEEAPYAVEAGRCALHEAWGDFEPPPRHVKTRAAMEGALVGYFAKWPLGADGFTPVRMPDNRLGIEIHFEWPLPMPHPETGAVLPYTGRLDLLAETAEGDVWVIDEKTTGLRAGYGISLEWGLQWVLDAGLTGYVEWARRALPHRNVVGVQVRGCGIGPKQYEFVALSHYRSPGQCAQWRAQVERDVQRWIDMYKSGVYDKALDHACAPYSRPCNFIRACATNL